MTFTLQKKHRTTVWMTNNEKKICKAVFFKAAYIEKPQGKPTLVLESDKRPAINTAKNDFMEEF